MFSCQVNRGRETYTLEKGKEDDELEGEELGQRFVVSQVLSEGAVESDDRGDGK